MHPRGEAYFNQVNLFNFELCNPFLTLTSILEQSPSNTHVVCGVSGAAMECIGLGVHLWTTSKSWWSSLDGVGQIDPILGIVKYANIESYSHDALRNLLTNYTIDFEEISIDEHSCNARNIDNALSILIETVDSYLHANNICFKR